MPRSTEDFGNALPASGAFAIYSPDGVCRAVTSAHASCLGLTTAEVVGRSLVELLGECARGLLREVMAREVVGDDFVRCEGGCLARTERLSMTLARVNDDAGRLLGLVSLVDAERCLLGGDEVGSEANLVAWVRGVLGFTAVVAARWGEQGWCLGSVAGVVGAQWHDSLYAAGALALKVGRAVGFSLESEAPGRGVVAVPFGAQEGGVLVGVAEGGGEVSLPWQRALLAAVARRLRSVPVASEGALGRLERELSAAVGRIDALRFRDPLTKLWNLDGLRRKVEVFSFSSVPWSAVLLDCDDFRRVNQRFGIAVGDLVLRQVAMRLANAVRPCDHVARVGGDEFLVLVEGMELAEVTEYGERLRLAISASPMVHAGAPIETTVSVGAIELGDGVWVLDEILSEAFKALLNSKDAGKNRTSGHRLQRVVLGQVGGCETQLMTAMKPANWAEQLLRQGTLRTLHQRIVRLADEVEVGQEILCRGPLGPFESPMDFFRLSAEQNMLTSVDFRCLQACLASAATVKGMAHINLFPSTILAVSPEQLVAFFTHVPGSFTLEINEQQCFGAPQALKGHVDALRRAGVRVALDDVGFGRSAIELLLVLEPDVVKIDRACVHGVSQSQDQARILSRLVKAVDALGAEMIAEGIEDRLDLAVVRDLGVTLGQGYLWGRPVSPFVAPGAVQAAVQEIRLREER